MKFFPEGLPRRILSYPKIEKAGCKGEWKTKFFPSSLPRRILFYEKLMKAGAILKGGSDGSRAQGAGKKKKRREDSVLPEVLPLRSKHL